MKKSSILLNCILLLWFFLDMTGVYFEKSYLVSTAWREDGIYFIIYLVSFILFIFQNKIGKYVLSGWLLIWLIAQFLSHEFVTIVGGGENKIKFFENSIKLFTSSSSYYPDLYHIILHILILLSLISTMRFTIHSKRKNSNNKIKQ